VERGRFSDPLESLRTAEGRKSGGVKPRKYKPTQGLEIYLWREMGNHYQESENTASQPLM
jgi:hypothetical protein